MAARVWLDDKYALDRGCVFISGTQALVRLPLMQLERDHAAGLQYGFQPGLNEDLAATAVWGAQQACARRRGDRISR